MALGGAPRARTFVDAGKMLKNIESAHSAALRIVLSALAHELGHAAGCENGATANCGRADEFGAAIVVTEDEYADAEHLVGEHLGAVARQLAVTRRLVLAWRRSHARTHPPAERLNDRTP